MADERPKVMVVDDEDAIVRALTRSLRRDGFEVVAFTNPAAALEALRTSRVDVVISDHLMPEMTGLQFLKLVRNRLPDSCRIMLTGHAEMQTAIDAINEGEIYRFLLKPWDDLDLKVTVGLGLERLNLERENRRLAAMVRVQQRHLTKLEAQYPSLSIIKRDEHGAILLDEA